MGNPHLWVSPYGPGLRVAGNGRNGSPRRTRINRPSEDIFFVPDCQKAGQKPLEAIIFIKKDAFSGLGKMMFRIFLYLCVDNNPKQLQNN